MREHRKRSSQRVPTRNAKDTRDRVTDGLIVGGRRALSRPANDAGSGSEQIGDRLVVGDRLRQVNVLDDIAVLSAAVRAGRAHALLPVPGEPVGIVLEPHLVGGGRFREDEPHWLLFGDSGGGGVSFAFHPRRNSRAW